MSSENASSSSASDAGVFDKWRKRFSVITGVGLTEQERLAGLQEQHGRICEKWKKEMMNYSQYQWVAVPSIASAHALTTDAGPSVVFMLKHLKHSGCDVSPENIVCAPCDFTRSGGFVPNAGAIVLCQNHFFSKKHMEETIVHELVHMYDHCKFKVDWDNLRHHACSEVGGRSAVLCSVTLHCLYSSDTR